MSFITTLTIMMFCLHAANATIVIAGVFDSDTGPIVNTNWVGPDAEECEGNNPCPSRITENINNLNDKNLVQDAAISSDVSLQPQQNVLFGLGALISNVAASVAYPLSFLQNACEELAGDPDATRVCSKQTGVGKIFVYLNYIIYHILFEIYL